ncbi:hypothetical protein HMPREF0580_1670 [Mobiluncus mulieris ATCC 35239]|uniref:Uncharacterized protein n=1 Tax=Mobiluncus mulieris ATCC 35239 TaxID=871571 RepID=E0QS05_9ACTO|nr:hypothetical protein HMPREF0580_1670 [Mobiluncus mulieris ATCC 35239]
MSAGGVTPKFRGTNNMKYAGNLQFTPICSIAMGVGINNASQRLWLW